MRRYVFSITILVAAAFSGFGQGFKINDKGYFANHGANVMVFSDVYPEGHQGGLTLIMNGNRVAGNGDVRLEVSPGQWQGLPRMQNRSVDRETETISVTSSYPDSSRHMSGFNPALYPDYAFNYTIRVEGVPEGVEVTVDLDKPVPAWMEGKIGFNLEIVPSSVLGQPWIMDGNTGIFPHQSTGPTMTQEPNFRHLGNFNPSGKADLDQLLLDRKTYNPMIADDIVSAPMAEGKHFVLNPHDPSNKISFVSLNGILKLYDGRINHNNGWFILRQEFKAGATREAAKFRIRPAVDKDWRYTPVVQTSQIGYYPSQTKIAVIEVDPRETSFQMPVLYRIEAEGEVKVKEAPARDWGDFLRYHYLQFDFSEVSEPGLYQVAYDNSRSVVFRIADDVFDRGVWQTEIEYFLPIQMCHMRVNEKYRVWHDYCHGDDAVMAKTNINHIDGYSQGASTLTRYAPGDRVPGLDIGGWHDAGDYDLRIESQAGESYVLALAFEHFGAYWDETSIDQVNRITEIHQPDGKNDILQQVENGALSIVAGWDALGRLYRGIICPTVRQYVHLGDASAHTDGHLGSWDDRWVFTEENPSRELSVAGQLAAVSRALRHFNDTLSARCLDIAQTLYRITDGSGERVKGNKLFAAVELYLSTGDDAYKQFVLENRDYLIRHIGNSGWYIGRFDKAIDDGEFSEAIRRALVPVVEQFQELSRRTPYGIPENRGNRSSGSWEPQTLAFQYSLLHESYPDLFDPDYIYNAVNYLLGFHPGANRASFVTGVGAETMKEAYGVNRADWSYVPGGVAPGTNLIRPDLPELLQFPFLWQEGEYCMGGLTTNFMYMVLLTINNFKR
ncbi:MAG: glycoside hydrolase [Bacteroidales bacterium]|jgi:hypothetical protein|nr:glycoside hydrolase family 9 protein [Bacteroidota bacterium]NLN98776.1 glycoside hydrolase [Bacteroidales bacterium]